MREVNGHAVNTANNAIRITVLDDPGAGGACHTYSVALPNGETTVLNFQKGPIAEAGTNGVTQEALLAIVADRLRYFQLGPFACRENTQALIKIEEAMHWLHSRTLNRIKRGVEGTNNI